MADVMAAEVLRQERLALRRLHHVPPDRVDDTIDLLEDASSRLLAVVSSTTMPDEVTRAAERLLASLASYALAARDLMSVGAPTAAAALLTRISSELDRDPTPGAADSEGTAT
jgi:hypothetical protein